MDVVGVGYMDGFFFFLLRISLHDMESQHRAEINRLLNDMLKFTLHSLLDS